MSCPVLLMTRSVPTFGRPAYIVSPSLRVNGAVAVDEPELDEPPGRSPYPVREQATTSSMLWRIVTGWAQPVMLTTVTTPVARLTVQPERMLAPLLSIRRTSDRPVRPALMVLPLA